MPSLKEVRTRIASVDSTKQITSAMKMVAASKLRRAQMAIINMRPYVNKLNELLQNISQAAELGEHTQTLIEDRGTDKVLLVVITSNRGLCGAFNANVIKRAHQLMQTDYANSHIDLITIGKKATDIFGKQKDIFKASYDDLFQNLQFDQVAPLANELLKSFEQKAYDRIVLVYNRFKNAATQELISEQWLPIAPEQNTTAASTPTNIQTDYLFEPSQSEILERLVPSILRTRFYRALLDSFASEHGARMTAMQQATDNAEEMLRDLKLTYNKARQAAITGEILEIVGGAEALKNT